MKKIILFTLVLIGLCTYLWISYSPPVRPPHTTPNVSPAPTPPAPVDPRIAALTAFFAAHNCPAINNQLIPDYLAAADKYNLDYRLLPGISYQESTCLEHYPVNSFNPYGWDSARTGFTSLQSAIDFISDKLANGHYYAGKTIERKLKAYNPNPSYAPKIIGLMKEIAS